MPCLSLRGDSEHVKPPVSDELRGEISPMSKVQCPKSVLRRWALHKKSYFVFASCDFVDHMVANLNTRSTKLHETKRGNAAPVQCLFRKRTLDFGHWTLDSLIRRATARVWLVLIFRRPPPRELSCQHRVWQPVRWQVEFYGYPSQLRLRARCQSAKFARR